MDRRNLLGVGGLATAAALAGGYPGAAAESAPNPAAEAVRQFAATLAAHDMEAFAALFADDYVNHQVSAAAPPPASGTTAKQGTVGFFAARLRGLPDLSVSIEASVANANMAAASFVYTGTHQGVYFGVAPTGRSMRFTSCDIFRVQDGKIAEHWGMGDIAGVLAQLKA
jgi:steroid delta-isomerase-like uncharacterized protein